MVYILGQDRKVWKTCWWSISWVKTERDGRLLLMVYILGQDRKGWKTFVDGLYPGSGQKGMEDFCWWSISWVRTERDGRLLLMVYILGQDRKGWKTFVDGLYPGSRQKGVEDFCWWSISWVRMRKEWKTFVDGLYPGLGWERNGRLLLMVYILTQDEKGMEDFCWWSISWVRMRKEWETFVDGLYPDPGWERLWWSWVDYSYSQCEYTYALTWPEICECRKSKRQKKLKRVNRLCIIVFRFLVYLFISPCLCDSDIFETTSVAWHLFLPQFYRREAEQGMATMVKCHHTHLMNCFQVCPWMRSSRYKSDVI